MRYDFEDSTYWFGWAKKMRNGANLMRDPGNKEIMLRIADDYARLGYRARQLPKRGQSAALHAASNGCNPDVCLEIPNHVSQRFESRSFELTQPAIYGFINPRATE